MVSKFKGENFHETGHRLHQGQHRAGDSYEPGSAGGHIVTLVANGYELVRFMSTLASAVQARRSGVAAPSKKSIMETRPNLKRGSEVFRARAMSWLLIRWVPDYRVLI
jgi:hypothetical protein